ncbi:MAG: dihydroorotate dehydrogenase 2 [Actinobacteria bacterium]|nr:MAG: dihydroorotate dehydrogenase 2 [Actinomycetota bacterium]
MGWYEAVGRRAFFSLDPERSHRLAYRLLRLPLPWRRIGGAVDDPALMTTLAGISLRNPIGLAAGFDKTCARLDALGSLGFGFVVGGTVTRAPRRGNARPRIARDPSRRALVNAMGMPNPGAEAVAHILARTARTAPRFASIADEPIADAVDTAELLEPFVDGIELNASSPNAGWEHASSHVAELVRALRARTSKPLFVKIPPFSGEDEERTRALSMATAARAAGASGIVSANTVPVVDTRMSTGRGGLSGGPLTAETPRMVAEIVAALAGEVPVVACGGVFTADDARRCLDAGAVAVQVYTALIYEGPGLLGSLTRGLAATVRTLD